MGIDCSDVLCMVHEEVQTKKRIKATDSLEPVAELLQALIKSREASVGVVIIPGGLAVVDRTRQLHRRGGWTVARSSLGHVAREAVLIVLRKIWCNVSMQNLEVVIDRTHRMAVGLP